MRYHELVERVSDEDSMAQIKEGARLVKKYCQPYLLQVNDPMKLRRGVARDYRQGQATDGRPIFNKKQAHLKDREAVLNPYHRHVNSFFDKKFGHPFRNGVMTTSNQMHASQFGIDVAVFPIGKFEFLWSPVVEDLNHSIDDMIWDNMEDDSTDQEKMHRALRWGLDKAEYQTTDLQGALEAKAEIMIWCEEYYTVDNNVDRMLFKKLIR